MLEEARRVREEYRRIEESFVRYTCPVCGHWVETLRGAVVWCQVDNRRCK